jgi:hypothetical protein
MVDAEAPAMLVLVLSAVVLFKEHGATGLPPSAPVFSRSIAVFGRAQMPVVRLEDFNIFRSEAFDGVHGRDGTTASTSVQNEIGVAHAQWMS